jgi:hypothetical protein
LELRKFHKQYSELVTSLDRWSSFLTRAHELDKNHLPKELENDKAIIKAITAVNRMFSAEERIMYQIRRQLLMETESKIASALDQGIEKGILQSLARLIENGIDEQKARELLGL